MDQASLGCGLLDSCSISSIPLEVKEEGGTTKSKGQIKLILVLTMNGIEGM